MRALQAPSPPRRPVIGLLVRPLASRAVGSGGTLRGRREMGGHARQAPSGLVHRCSRAAGGGAERWLRRKTCWDAERNGMRLVVPSNGRQHPLFVLRGLGITSSSKLQQRGQQLQGSGWRTETETVSDRPRSQRSPPRSSGAGGAGRGEDDPQRVDDARDPPQQGQQDVEQELSVGGVGAGVERARERPPPLAPLPPAPACRRRCAR